MRVIVWMLVLCFSPSLLTAEEKRFSYTELHMGTRFQIILYANDAQSAEQAQKQAFARIAELNRIMSDYDRSSELMRLCQNAHQKPVKVSKELFFVLNKAEKLSQETKGAFDITIGPITRSWRLARKRLKMPKLEKIKGLLQQVGYEKIKLNEKNQTVKLKTDNMRLDLGGIAKGYAADEVIRILKTHGITRALVAAGGDIVVSDAPPEKDGWKVGIAPLTNPDGKPEQYLLLKNQAVSTSGDAEQYVLIDGKRYSHIVDPRTGIGILGQSSVTVIAPKGIDTDSLATTISILGPQQGMKLIKCRSKTEVFIIRKTDGKKEIIQSKGFENYLIK